VRGALRAMQGTAKGTASQEEGSRMDINTDNTAGGGVGSCCKSQYHGPNCKKDQRCQIQGWKAL
jgi:hypothetical protein